MKYRPWLLASAISASVSLSSMAGEPVIEGEEVTPGNSMDGKDGAIKKVDDASITAEIKSRLAATKDASSLQVDISSHQGVVTLEGTALSQEEKRNAEDVARNVAGVEQVINRLEVSPPPI
jgi:hyperosmotically inducible periplasmic protein